MDTKLDLGNFPISYRGDFDLKGIYELGIKWIGAQEMKYFEELYKEKDSNPGCKDIEFKQSGDVKLDDFHRWKISIFIQMFDVQPNNKGSHTGRLQMYISGNIVRDWQGKYEKSAFGNKLLKVIMRARDKDEDFKYWDTYYYKLVGLSNDYKELLGTPVSRNFA